MKRTKKVLYDNMVKVLLIGKDDGLVGRMS